MNAIIDRAGNIYPTLNQTITFSSKTKTRILVAVIILIALSFVVPGLARELPEILVISILAFAAWTIFKQILAAFQKNSDQLIGRSIVRTDAGVFLANIKYVVRKDTWGGIEKLPLVSAETTNLAPITSSDVNIEFFFVMEQAGGLPGDAGSLGFIKFQLTRSGRVLFEGAHNALFLSANEITDYWDCYGKNDLKEYIKTVVQYIEVSIGITISEKTITLSYIPSVGGAFIAVAGFGLLGALQQKSAADSQESRVDRLRSISDGLGFRMKIAG